MIRNLLDCTIDTPILAMSLDLQLPREMQQFFCHLFVGAVNKSKFTVCIYYTVSWASVTS